MNSLRSRDSSILSLEELSVVCMCVDSHTCAPMVIMTVPQVLSTLSLRPSLITLELANDAKLADQEALKICMSWGW